MMAPSPVHPHNFDNLLSSTPHLELISLQWKQSHCFEAAGKSRWGPCGSDWFSPERKGAGKRTGERDWKFSLVFDVIPIFEEFYSFFWSFWDFFFFGLNFKKKQPANFPPKSSCLPFSWSNHVEICTFPSQSRDRYRRADQSKPSDFSQFVPRRRFRQSAKSLPRDFLYKM